MLIRKYQGYIGTNGVFRDDAELAKSLNDTEKNPSNPNPGMRDIASLEANCNTLVVVGGLKFVNSYAEASTSDSKAFRDYQREFASAYVDSGRLAGLLQKYLENLVNGKVLWRNQYGFSRKTFVTLKTATSTEVFKLVDGDTAGMDLLVAHIAPIAAAKNGYFLLEVAVTVELGADAEVFPSQPFLTDKDKVRPDNGGSYGRVLSSRKLEKEDQAILTAQKVGNALRTVDDTYADGAEAIAVEIYGAVTATREVFRAGNSRKNSFFDLIQRDMTTLTEVERDFVMAVLLKGGLFGFGK